MTQTVPLLVRVLLPDGSEFIFIFYKTMLGFLTCTALALFAVGLPIAIIRGQQIVDSKDYNKNSWETTCTVTEMKEDSQCGIAARADRRLSSNFGRTITTPECSHTIYQVMDTCTFDTQLSATVGDSRICYVNYDCKRFKYTISNSSNIEMFVFGCILMILSCIICGLSVRTIRRINKENKERKEAERIAELKSECEQQETPISVDYCEMTQKV